MPRFIYKVRDKQGQERQATEEAVSEEALISRLQNQDLTIISVSKEEVAGKAIRAGRLHARLTLDDRIIFARQLATLLEAGVTLLKSLDILTKQIESRVLLKAVTQVKKDIAGGSSFHDALAKHPQIFSEFWVNIVQTGEASGALPAVLTQLSEYLESSAAMRRKVVSALVYPILLIFMAIAAMIIFTVWIIPIFSRIFDSFEVDLPPITRMVLALSNFARKYFLILCGGVGALIYLVSKYIQTERGKWQFDQLKFKIPILSTLFQRIAIERFASGLATLVESGVPIIYGLEIVGKATGNKVVENAIMQVKESAREGGGMSQPLERSGVFTPMVVQLVAVGEEIGELGKMLRRISEFYKERVTTALERIATVIEPAVLIIMGAVVGTMVVSIFLPIFQMAMIAGG